MKKIGIVTHYGVHNHGAQLQLFALITILRSKGMDVHALQFDKDYRYMDATAKNKYKISIKSIPFYTKYLFEKGIKKTIFNYSKKRIFDTFRTKNNVLGERYYDFNGDCIIVGSDEVFSIETGLTDAFWGNNAKTKKIISYAGSFGPTNQEEIEKKNVSEYILKALGNFEKITVRDKNSKEIIENFLGKDIELVCDPVILYGYKKEIETRKENKLGRYILVYSYDNNMNDTEDVVLIKQVAKELNLPVYSIGFYHKWCDRNINADPIELLGYFKNAEYIITDTFHGTVMSLITESRFATKLRGNSNKLRNLLFEYNLENRIYESKEECSNILNSEIDYEKVNSLMGEYRKKSLSYLLNAID